MIPTTLAEAWLHDISPFILRFGQGNIGIRWYGTAYALGFVAAYVLLRWLSNKRVTPLSHAQLADILLTLVAGVIVGGRLGYVLFYNRALLTFTDASFPWWGPLMITHGGMSFHGGVIGVMLAAWWCVRTLRRSAAGPARHVSWPHLMDLLAFASTIGLGLGRIANFINGELLGKIVAMPGAPAPWWSVKYPQELLTRHAPGLSPQQSEALAALVGRFAREGDRAGNDIARMIAALQRGGPASRELGAELAPLLAARHPSQLYQAFLEGVVLTAILWFVWRKPRRAGVVGCWFLIGYGVMRIAAEFIRLPDDHQKQQLIAGLSLGQWLSVWMILVGAVVLGWIMTRREPQPQFGGWLRQQAAQP